MDYRTVGEIKEKCVHHVLITILACSEPRSDQYKTRLWCLSMIPFEFSLRGEHRTGEVRMNLYRIRDRRNSFVFIICKPYFSHLLPIVRHRKHLLGHILISLWLYMHVCLPTYLYNTYIYKASEGIIKGILLGEENTGIFFCVGLGSINSWDPISFMNVNLAAPFCQQTISAL